MKKRSISGNYLRLTTQLPTKEHHNLQVVNGGQEHERTAIPHRASFRTTAQPRACGGATPAPAQYSVAGGVAAGAAAAVAILRACRAILLPAAHRRGLAKTAAIACVTIIAACTPYQPSGLLGGFSETQLSENTFAVNFQGNGYTSRERVNDFAMLRAAELTQAHGFKYFQIAGAAANDQNTQYTTPVTAHTSGWANTNFMGNQAYTSYSGTTEYSGGETYNITMPGSALGIICFKSKPKDIPVLEASFVANSIRTKYKIGEAPKATKPAEAASFPKPRKK